MTDIICEQPLKVADNSITAGDKDKVINYKKVQRIRKKSREEKKDKFRGFKAKGLMVEERIDDNKVETGVGVKNNKRFGVVRREDCAVIGYPGEVFLGHVALEGGRGWSWPSAGDLPQGAGDQYH